MLPDRHRTDWVGVTKEQESRGVDFREAILEVALIVGPPLLRGTLLAPSWAPIGGSEAGHVQTA